MKLSRLDIITTMSKLENLKRALSKANVAGMTVSQVLGCGVQRGTKEYEIEENQEMELLPKEMITLFVPSDTVESLVDIIKKELYTGHIGDGKIFISSVENVVRIRTGEDGRQALE